MKALYFIYLLIPFLVSEISAHPVHVSVSNLELTGDEPIIAIKLFKDDLQLAIYHNYGVEIPVNQIDDETHTEIILKYLLNNFIIKLNKNEELRLKYRNSETNDEAIWIYFSSNIIPPVPKIIIINSLFLDIYNDQTNLLIISYARKQNGYRFDNKVKELEIILK